VRVGAYFGKYVFVVDDDIDPYDIDDVLWALCSRSEPVEIDIIKQAWSTPLDPRIRKPSDSYTNSRAIIYGVKPFGWYNEFPPTVEVDPELRKEVLSKWGGIFGDRWRSTQRQDLGGGWK
jgi:3-polyprenyl-4-hydroxybenzoate decarboxylase